MNNRVLLTGSSGLLGIGLLKTQPKNFAISATYFKDDFVLDYFKAKFIHIDLTGHSRVSQLLRENDFFSAGMILLISSGGIIMLQRRIKE